MHLTARLYVMAGGKNGGKRLALARLHFCNFTLADFISG